MNVTTTAELGGTARDAVSRWTEDGEGGKALVLEIYLDDAVLAVLDVIGTGPEGPRP